MRDLNRKIDEVSLALKIDTPWRKLEDHLGYGVRALQTIPLATRVLLVVGFIIAGVGVIMRNLKMITAGADVMLLSIIVVGEL